MNRAVVTLLAVLPLALAPLACQSALPPDAQARALDGTILYAPPIPAEELAKRNQQLAAAQDAYERSPQDADALVWYGRRLAYVGRFRESIDVFTKGIAEHPDDARMYRHRGHRYITTREFARAVPDLTKAAELVKGKPDEVEPDLAANATHPPLETLQSNIYYHLGLAHYLLGHWERAREAYLECRRVSLNPDNLCSVTHWLYMTLRRMDREDEANEALAQISEKMPVLEYHAYHNLCLAYAGKHDIDLLYDATKRGGVDTVDFATIGYGVGNWHRYNGERNRAFEIWREVVSGAQWHAFGHVAAEDEFER
jgi:tetratricopeptide (TPR) repeat protein